MLKVLFIGGFTGNTGTGEEPDEIHMSRCLDQAGVNVTNADRAEIHAFFTGAKQDNIPPAEDYDIILLCKWHHFTKEIIQGVKDRYKGELVYFVWDWMGDVGWHNMILNEADYYLSGELGIRGKCDDKKAEYRYFNWDSSDGQYDQLPRDEKYDVTFTGTYIPHSYRNQYLRAVQEKFGLTVFSFDYERWRKEGFKAEPGKYGGEFNQLSAQSKVMLCMNWVEPSAETMGYQSNRIGKITTTGGLPLVHYFPMSERLLSDKIMVWYNESDLLNKIDWLLHNNEQRETARVLAYDYGRAHFTTQTRMRELKNLLESL